ncbi:aminotransferase class V-fold PLP-dependent enzyme [bacterium]|nr:aminotransferase class V-fold PLP-dependent enzyme [bacterium]
MLKLLNPGPVSLTQRVRDSLQKPDLCHREPEFFQMQRRIRQGLINVYDCSQEYSAVLLTGSGTAAVEAMVGSLVAREADPALVVANGVYGERMAAMLKRHGKPHRLVSSGWTEGMDLEGVERAIQSCSCVLAVHHETTTGRLNDLHRLGALCRQANRPLLLDAVSSFGGAEIDFEGWNLLACAATANKCLHGVPGVSFVVARREALQQPGHSPSLYLDLQNYYSLQEQDGSPFTQAVQACYGLDEALAELAESGGWKARCALYAERTRQLEAGLKQRGIVSFLSEGQSCILGSYRLPAGVSYEQLHDRLKAAGFVIYAGQGGFSHEMFRIAVMGDLSSGDLDRLLAAFPAS